MLDFIISVSFGIFTIIISIVLSGSRHPPGKTPCPQSYPVIGNLIAFLRNRHRFHDWVAEMLSQTPTSTLQVYGFLNLSSGICTANPLNIEHLLVSNFSNYIKGSRFHDVLQELLGDGIFNVDGHLWTAQRKIASHEFNTRSLKRFISDTVSSEILMRLLPCLSRSCDENRVIDLQEVLRQFAFDNICRLAFGVDPAWLNSDKVPQSMSNLAFVQAFDDAVEINSDRLLSPIPLIWKFKRFFNIGSEKRLKEAIDMIENFAMEIISSREKEEESSNNAHEDDEKMEKSPDLLSRFMSLSASLEFQDRDQRRKFLRDIIISFMLAGKDSTSTALTWFFWLIAGHPRCAELIYTEVSSVPVTATSRPGIFSYNELKSFHYLHAALSESLRLFPPVPINSKLTVDDDVLPDGTHLRKGQFADYSAYAVGRMERVWGDDCREFKPERWLNTEGVFQPSDQFRFPVFHCGPRICLGKEMAYVQMKSIAAYVIHEFEIMAVDGGGCAEKMMHPPYTLSLLLKKKGGLHVNLNRRQ